MKIPSYRKEKVFWEEALVRLALKTSPILINLQEAELIVDMLPAKTDENETLFSRLKRLNQGWTPICEFIRLAADSGDTDALPDDGYVESCDGRFRLGLHLIDNKLHIEIEALSLAVSEFAHQRIGLLGKNQFLLAQVTLDEYGDGEIHIDDSPEVRTALLNPMIVLINNPAG